MARSDAVRTLDRFPRAALARYALTQPELRPFASSFNDIYRVSAVEGEFVLRVSPRQCVHSAHAAQAEQAWTDRIRSAGLSAPTVVGTRDGGLVVTEDGPAARRAVILTWIAGKVLEQPFPADRITSLGELSARLHQATPPSSTRPAGVLDASSPTLFAVPDVLESAPPGHREILRQRSKQAREWLHELWSSEEEVPRVLHFDLTPKNVVEMDGEGLAVIDCEDLAWGHRAQDIANTIYGITHGEFDAHAITMFRTGYERHAAWPDLDDERLRQLFIVRRIGMVNLSLTLRRPGLAEYLDSHAAALTQ